jgi:phosphatidylethanolamine-binding protein (PEBP) family uncharacterized protein
MSIYIYRRLAILFLSFSLLSCHKDENNSTSTTDKKFTLTSIGVVNGFLAEAYKCEKKVNGVENSLPVAWSNAPITAKSFAMSMIDYPNPKDSVNFNCNLVLWGIPETTSSIGYGQMTKGPWFLGSNKDAIACSYTSPCSKDSGTHQYILKIYALTATPSSLPSLNSVNVTYSVLRKALTTVTIIDSSTLIFYSITP